MLNCRNKELIRFNITKKMEEPKIREEKSIGFINYYHL